MAHYKYLIIGAGLAADAAVRGIREIDNKGTIALIGNEADPPYNRPSLSKGLWKGKSFDSIWKNTKDLTVDLLLGKSVVALNPKTKTIKVDSGAEYTYEKLLLATGGTPRRLPFGGENILYFRSLQDYRYLRGLCGQKKKFGVIGGGFIGSEIAAALTMVGEEVIMVFPEESIGAKVYPREISFYLNDYFRNKGVTIQSGVNVLDLQKTNSQLVLISDKNPSVQVDHVVAGIGITPNVELARQAGLDIGNGIKVDASLRTNDPDIFAAGDVAEFYQPDLHKQVRIEHEDNALSMGKQAGRNMAGVNETYQHLSYFYTDLFELGYEAVGELDSRMETFIDWKEPFNKGVIYYLVEGRVKGVLLWNVWDSVPAARSLINEPGPFTPNNLKNRI